MTDWWNDPPEEPDPPTCPECAGEADFLRAGPSGHDLRCDDCGHEWTATAPDEPSEPDEPAAPDEPDEPSEPTDPDCPHGKPWGECGACDHAGDLAFDAAREARLFRR